MFTQNKSATARPKLHSIHALSSGSAFTAKIEIGKSGYQFTFAPKTAEVSSGKLKLKGTVTVLSPAGQKRSVENAEAILLSTQGSIQPAPPAPVALPGELKPAKAEALGLPITDATDDISSIGVMYLKLSPLDGRALGVPMDLSAIQINARLYPQSEIERDLQWLYSSWLLAMHGGNEQTANGYLAEINHRLKS